MATKTVFYIYWYNIKINIHIIQYNINNVIKYTILQYHIM